MQTNLRSILTTLDLRSTVSLTYLHPHGERDDQSRTERRDSADEAEQLVSRYLTEAHITAAPDRRITRDGNTYSMQSHQRDLRAQSAFRLLLEPARALTHEHFRRQIELLPTLWVLAEALLKQRHHTDLVHELPVRRQLSVFRMEFQKTCQICHDDTATVETPCGHAFHEGCLRGWVHGRGATSCPVCRENLFLSAFELYFEHRAAALIPRGRELTRTWFQAGRRPGYFRWGHEPGLRVIARGNTDTSVTLGQFRIDGRARNADEEGRAPF